MRTTQLASRTPNRPKGSSSGKMTGLLRIPLGAKAEGELALMTASRKTSPGPGNVLLSGDGLVLAYSKPRPSGEHVDAGVIAVRKQVVELIPPDRSCSFEEEILPKLIEKSALKAFATDVPFFDMGTPAGLAALQAHLA